MSESTKRSTSFRLVGHLAAKPIVAIAILAAHPTPTAIAFSRDSDAVRALEQLRSITPRRAVLVVYCPGVQPLTAAVRMLSAINDCDDALARTVAKRLERFDSALSAIREQLGLSVADLNSTLQGGFLVGWMPAPGASRRRFQSDRWTLVARRRPGDEPAIERLRTAILRQSAGAGMSIRRHAIAGLTVEQVTVEEEKLARISPRAVRRKGPRPPGMSPRIEAREFGEILRIERRALSLGLNRKFLFFTPSAAENLEPWVRAATDGTAQPTTDDDLASMVERAAASGTIVLALQAKPPAWVPLKQSKRERRLGPHPFHALLSQARSLNLVVSRQGRALLIDGEATLLPAPGWAARLIATLAEGADLDEADRCSVEIVVRADYGRLWRALHDVLAEGWPAVAMALDSFLAPPGAEDGVAAASLAETLGQTARFMLFRPTGHDGLRPRWAVAIDLKDPRRFAWFETRIDRLLGAFSVEIEHYDAGDHGRLTLREKVRTTTGSRMGLKLYTVRSPTRFAVANSRRALADAVGLGAPPGRLPDNDRESLAPSAARRGKEVKPAIALRYEIGDRPSQTFTLDGRLRRTIRTPSGAIELISPPVEGKPPKRPRPTKAGSPRAVLTATLAVKSEKKVGFVVTFRPLAKASEQVGSGRPAGQIKRPTIAE